MPLPHFPRSKTFRFRNKKLIEKRIKIIKQIIRYIRINKIKQIIYEN